MLPSVAVEGLLVSMNTHTISTAIKATNMSLSDPTLSDLTLSTITILFNGGSMPPMATSLSCREVMLFCLYNFLLRWCEKGKENPK
jgi:hypothetical protein